MKRDILALGWILATFGAVVFAGRANGQAPTIEPGPGGTAPRAGSSLGTLPGSGGNVFDIAPGSDRPIIGGSTGPSRPNVPPSISNPGGAGMVPMGAQGMAATPTLPAANLPLYGPLQLPGEGEAFIGPPSGMTLDMAIERLLRESLSLRAKSFEIPMAQADILTAGLRANPIFYADGQLIPYGQYSAARPGGQTQYDINISYPLDLSHKRQARAEVATQVKRTLEAQFQDSARLEINNLYTAFVDVLAAEETVKVINAAITGLNEVLETVQERKQFDIMTEANVNSVKVQREFALIELADAERTVSTAKLQLANQLSLLPSEAENLQIRGSLRDTAPPPPGSEELIQIALNFRPDLIAYRQGIRRSYADVQLALANRFSDVYVLYQPYTLQDNTYQGLKSATSWALGVTVPLPIYNRNQGNIERARINVDQSKVELETQTRLVVAEVKRAEQEYRITRQAVERIEKEIQPASQQVLKTAELLWRSGTQDILYYLNARSTYNDFVRQYLVILLRHRRSMLSLNTAVGRRILP